MLPRPVVDDVRLDSRYPKNECLIIGAQVSDLDCCRGETAADALAISGDHDPYLLRLLEIVAQVLLLVTVFDRFPWVTDATMPARNLAIRLARFLQTRDPVPPGWLASEWSRPHQKTT
jgi:hypothetical protein